MEKFIQEAHKPTTEQIAKSYSAMLDSVNLIKQYKTDPPLALGEDVEHIISINKEHLRFMLLKDFWTNEDMTPINEVLNEE